jgi:hypothetical protein
MIDCASLKLRDAKGCALETPRYGCMPDDHPKAVTAALSDVAALRKRRPALLVGVTCDGAREMWNLLDVAVAPTEPEGTVRRLVDLWHLPGYGGKALRVRREEGRASSDACAMDAATAQSERRRASPARGTARLARPRCTGIEWANSSRKSSKPWRVTANETSGQGPNRRRLRLWPRASLRAAAGVLPRVLREIGPGFAPVWPLSRAGSPWAQSRGPSADRHEIKWVA